MEGVGVKRKKIMKEDNTKNKVKKAKKKKKLYISRGICMQMQNLPRAI